jgi:hypothetical protein
MTESSPDGKERTVHEELVKQLKATLMRLSISDPGTISKFLRHSWFFFGIIVRSMAQHLLFTKRIKVVDTHCTR